MADGFSSIFCRHDRSPPKFQLIVIPTHLPDSSRAEEKLGSVLDAGEAMLHAGAVPSPESRISSGRSLLSLPPPWVTVMPVTALPDTVTATVTVIAVEAWQPVPPLVIVMPPFQSQS